MGVKEKMGEMVKAKNCLQVRCPGQKYGEVRVL